jgi:hypothetical protein
MDDWRFVPFFRVQALEAVYFSETLVSTYKSTLRCYSEYQRRYPFNTVLLVKLIVAHVVKKLSSFCGAKRFITVFKVHTTGPCPKPIHTLPIFFSIWILSFHLRLGFPTGFSFPLIDPTTNQQKAIEPKRILYPAYEDMTRHSLRPLVPSCAQTRRADRVWNRTMSSAGEVQRNNV